ncbi:MAG TPA: hypothetical protein VMT11_12850 [Myxococcaceae bacterium]|nr:hypothetical protein [Myxococcaceae bacterium]
MFGSAGTRFWRGVREPWQLMARMRAHPPLWHRYWRIVGIQVVVTVLAGAVVFWVGKQGADVWRDAFEPEPAPASSAPATTSAASPPAGGALPAATPGPTETRAARPGEPSPAGAPQAAKDAAAAAGEPEEEVADEEEESDAQDNSDARIEAAARALEHAPPSERAKRTTELLDRALSRAKQKSEHVQRRTEASPVGGPEQTGEALQEERTELHDDLEELRNDAEELASHPPTAFAEARAQRRKLERRLERLERRAADLSSRGTPPLTMEEAGAITAVRSALGTARSTERGLRGRLNAILALLAALYASLSIAQAGVLAMSRDFHDALSRELSLLVQVAPEDPPMRPRIRLDVPWVRRKTNRRVQFFLGFLPGIVLISAVTSLLPLRRPLVSLLTACWSAYWWVVMTAGQTARAWSPPETTPPPWYLRGWNFLTTRVFLFRWALPRAWGGIWARFARRFYGPSERVEEQPLEFAGLALSRAVALFPIFKLLVRPVFPVAAAHLLVEHAALARLPVPVTAMEVADAAARAPDPEARAHSGVAG